MAFLDRDGVRIYYDAQGSGPAVLLSHGYASTSQMWTKQVEALKDRYRVITWDMRGHGQSDSPDDQSLYSEEATCGDMAGILRELGIERAIVGGLSLGGYMSLAFNVRYPEMVSALMLFDTGPGYKNPVGREGWNKTAEGSNRWGAALRCALRNTVRQRGWRRRRGTPSRPGTARPSPPPAPASAR